MTLFNPPPPNWNPDVDNNCFISGLTFPVNTVDLPSQNPPPPPPATFWLVRAKLPAKPTKYKGIAYVAAGTLDENGIIAWAYLAQYGWNTIDLTWLGNPPSGGGGGNPPTNPNSP
jgi:hypothetical protein